MVEISTFRLLVLRATYLLIVIGLGLDIWPSILRPAAGVSLMATVVRSVLGAVSILALVGLRHPLRMLPLLLFELAWKTIWIVAFGLPLWLGGRMDAAAAETLQACAMGLVIFPLALPWGYLRDRYVKRSGDRWPQGLPS